MRCYIPSLTRPLDRSSQTDLGSSPSLSILRRDFRLSTGNNKSTPSAPLLWHPSPPCDCRTGTDARSGTSLPSYSHHLNRSTFGPTLCASRPPPDLSRDSPDGSSRLPTTVAQGATDDNSSRKPARPVAVRPLSARFGDGDPAQWLFHVLWAHPGFRGTHLSCRVIWMLLDGALSWRQRGWP